MNENVIITDKKKIEEIQTTLKSAEHSIAHIKSAAPDKLHEKKKKIWFGIDKP